MPFCSCDDVELYYEVHGQGYPLLLISGLSSGTWTWYGQIPYFQIFFQTIIFDNRGAGRSSIPEGPYQMKQFAQDSLSLLDHLQVDQAFVMGLSMGGMIAQELALLAPHRVRALVLGCTHCGGDISIRPSQEVLAVLTNNAGLTHEQIIDKNLPLLFSEECRRNHPEVISSYRIAQLEAPAQPDDAFRAQLGAIAEFDCCERLSQLDIPVMIITGSKDTLVPRENAYIMSESIPEAEIIVLQGAGHALHIERSGELNSLANHFFHAFKDETASEGTP